MQSPRPHGSQENTRTYRSPSPYPFEMKPRPPSVTALFIGTRSIPSRHDYVAVLGAHRVLACGKTRLPRGCDFPLRVRYHSPARVVIEIQLEATGSCERPSAWYSFTRKARSRLKRTAPLSSPRQSISSPTACSRGLRLIFVQRGAVKLVTDHACPSENAPAPSRE